MFTCFIVVLMSGCTQQNSDQERAKVFQEILTKLRSCIPVNENQQANGLKMAIVDIENNSQETAVKIVAYAADDPVDFDLPVYTMSRGRWLINEKGRAYLLDDSCREYKLKDRRAETSGKIPQDGRVHLNPGQAFEAILCFPVLSDKAQCGVLVFGNRVLPFLRTPFR